MRGEGNCPEEKAQDRVAGRAPGEHDAAPAVRTGVDGCRRPHPVVPPLQDALTATLRRRVAQWAARDHRARPPLVGSLCERCLDAPALLVQPAPWGGEMGVCAACQQEPPADNAETPRPMSACGASVRGVAPQAVTSRPRRRAAVASSHGVRRRVTFASAG
jgi:hypothetical protein